MSARLMEPCTYACTFKMYGTLTAPLYWLVPGIVQKKLFVPRSDLFEKRRAISHPLTPWGATTIILCAKEDELNPPVSWCGARGKNTTEPGAACVMTAATARAAVREPMLPLITVGFPASLIAFFKFVPRAYISFGLSGKA